MDDDFLFIIDRIHQRNKIRLENFVHTWKFIFVPTKTYTTHALDFTIQYQTHRTYKNVLPQGSHESHEYIKIRPIALKPQINNNK